MPRPKDPDARRRSLGLRTKIVLFLLPAMVPLAAVLFHNHIMGGASVRTRTETLCRLVTEDGATRINELLRECRESLEQWSRDDGATRLGQCLAAADLDATRSELDSISHATLRLSLVALTDEAGRVVAVEARDGSDRSDLIGLQASEAEPVLGSSRLTVQRRRSDLAEKAGLAHPWTFVFGVGTYDPSGTPNGALLAIVDWQDIEDELWAVTNRFLMGELPGTLAVIANRRSGSVLCGPVGVTAGRNDRPAPGLDPAAVRQWMREVDGFGATKRLTHGEESYYATFWPIHDPESLAVDADRDATAKDTDGPRAASATSELGLITLTPGAPFLSAVKRFRHNGLLLVLLGVWATLGTSWLVSGWVSRRVLKFVRCLRSVTENEGNLARRVPVDCGDELGQLAASMNGFLEKLQTTVSELRESRERVASISDLTSDFSYSIRVDDRRRLTTEWVAGAIAGITGYSAEEIEELGGWVNLVIPEDRATYRRQLAGVISGEAQKSEYRIRTRSDEIRWIVGYVKPEVDEETGRVVRFYGAAKDNTERRNSDAEKQRLEQHMRRNQRLESVGLLAGGVAHDFNNLLTGILGYVSLLREEPEDSECVLRAAEVIEDTAQKASELTLQLMGFARKGKHQDAPVDMNRMIADLVTLLRRTVDRRIGLTTSLMADPPIARGDPDQLRQVIMNIAVNAVEALDGAGEILIGTRLVDLEESELPPGAGLRPGLFLELTVEDNGEGIPEEVQERIFDPFFTTKEAPESTGMGLAMAYGIVKNHGGHIRMESRTGCGTTFWVLIPAHYDRIKPMSSQPAELEKGSGLVQVVDDEEYVREIMQEMLERLGYEVLLADDGQEALDVYSERGDEIILVVLDINMPRMGGVECFAKLRGMDPEARCLIATGFAQEGTIEELLKAGAVGLLRKPFVYADLSAAVVSALEPTANPA